MDSTPLNSFVHRPFGRFVWNVESTRKTILFLETSDSGAGNTILFLCTKDSRCYTRVRDMKVYLSMALKLKILQSQNDLFNRKEF